MTCLKMILLQFLPISLENLFVNVWARTGKLTTLNRPGRHAGLVIQD